MIVSSYCLLNDLGGGSSYVNGTGEKEAVDCLRLIEFVDCDDAVVNCGVDCGTDCGLCLCLFLGDVCLIIEFMVDWLIILFKYFVKHQIFYYKKNIWFIDLLVYWFISFI